MEVYEEIAATKMQRIRKTVTASCDYFEGLAKLSEEVALDLDNAFEGKNKFAAVFLSANTGLYGDIVKKVFYTFVSDIKDKDVKVSDNVQDTEKKPAAVLLPRKVALKRVTKKSSEK